MIRYKKSKVLQDKYKLTDEDMQEIPEIILDRIALRMRMILSGDRVNTKQAALTLLRDYRSKKLGKFGLDKDMSE